MARSSSAFSDNSSKRAASSSVSSTPSNSLSLSASYSLPHDRLDQSLFFRASPFGSISKSSTSYLHFPSAPRSQPVACLIFLAFSFSFVWRIESKRLSLTSDKGELPSIPAFCIVGAMDSNLPFSMLVSLWS